MPLPRLSILIATLERRRHFLARLQSRLALSLTPEVEVIIDDGGEEFVIGQKRNRLMQRATGDYVAFIDDDDLVSEDYCIRLLRCLWCSPDCASLVGHIVAVQHPARPCLPFYHSIRHTDWIDTPTAYYRPPNHLNAVRRELALQVPFKPLPHGEDRDYSLRLRPLLKNEANSGAAPLYFYEYRRDKSNEADLMPQMES